MASSSSPYPESSPSLSPETLIGREEIVDTIRSALKDVTGKSYVFYLLGAGGIGKTRLLEEVSNITHSLDTTLKIRNTKIIDLYDANNHSPNGIRRQLIQSLDPNDEFFGNYRAVLSEYRKKRAQGAPRRTLEEMRGQLEQEFNSALEKLSHQYRIVICLDTLELLQHESDEVQKICSVQDTDTQIQGWLLNQVKRLKNAVVLCAGRPDKENSSKFLENLQTECAQSAHKFRQFTLEAFDEEESKRFLEVLRRQRPQELNDFLTPSNMVRLHEITGGKPIYLALVTDLAAFVTGIDILAYSVNEPALRQELGEALARINEKQYGKHAIESGDILHYLLRARKGLNEDLLMYLAKGKIDVEVVRSQLNRAQKFAIVKSRVVEKATDIEANEDSLLATTHQLFLHDEVYNLIDEYYGEKTSFNLAFKPFAEYCEGQLKLAKSDSERKSWQLDQLYYELQTNPHSGYLEYYVNWDEAAIVNHEIEFDMRLRDETLRFFNRYANPGSEFNAERVHRQIDRSAVDRDCAVRWIKRHIAKGENQQAAELAHRIRNDKSDLFNWDTIADPLYKANLLTAWSHALLYLLDSEPSPLDILNQAIQILTDDALWQKEQQQFRQRTLGQVNNNKGYYYRTIGRYGLARKYYQLALGCFAGMNVPEEEANTKNNLAFVLAALGRLPAARKHAQDAFAQRKAQGKQYPMALSQNNLGYIYTMEEHPIWGIKECEQALSFFKDFRSARGEGLACNVLGFAYRKRGEQWKLGPAIYPNEEAEGYFSESEQYLLRAVAIFSEYVEPIRLWEAYNELGSLFCDWAWFEREAKQDSTKALNYYAQAIDYQKKALAEAERKTLTIQIADSLDDLAQASADLSFLLRQIDQSIQADAYRKEAERYLSQVEQLVPDAFRLAEQKDSEQTKPVSALDEEIETSEAFWLALGKVQFWRGVWQFRDLQYNGVRDERHSEMVHRATEQLIEAIAYFELYGESSSYLLQRTLRYFSEFMQQEDVTPNEVRSQVEEFSDRYGTELRMLKEAVDDMLGL